MPEEILFETESVQSRGDVATYLRSIADKLDGGDPVTLTAGSQSVTLEVPDRPTFEVKAERETSAAGEPGELSLELELEWDERVEESDETLSIE